MGFREELAADAAELEAGGRLRLLREITPEGDGLCRCNGRTFWNFSSNDYMGIAADANGINWRHLHFLPEKNGKPAAGDPAAPEKTALRRST